MKKAYLKIGGIIGVIYAFGIFLICYLIKKNSTDYYSANLYDYWT